MDKEKFFVVVLLQQKLLVIPEKYVESVTEFGYTKVFFSENTGMQPNFDINTKYYFCENENACYEAFIVRSFGK